ncbi:unnamed protein product [Didymodactylos carnosus]|uniref:Uncharacterized protein n=1 Tax=Didymodactylos carnosus TaxID=1234261 RepID=A0A814LA79_9BILA|nr:unnamed protein product [Didymodactylos carnosus]CAF3831032.1 unnamed protein product [Didymodactylos carnosus]
MIQPESPSLTVDVNDVQEYHSVNLKCSAINGNPSPTFSWYRDNIPIQSSSLVRDVENGSILTLNMTRKDNGVKFECQIWNPALSSPLHIEQRIIVKYLPYVNILSNSSLIQSTTDRILTMEHIDEEFICEVDANPRPTSIYWTLNNTTIVSREKRLYFYRLKSEQSGNYTCIVENALGIVKQSIYIDVQYAPRVRSIDKILKVNRSDQVKLRCSIKSYPNAHEIIWYKDKIEISRYKIDNDDKIEYRIDRVERNDTGNYTCMAINRISLNKQQQQQQRYFDLNGSAIIELIVYSRPVMETTYSKIASEIGQSVKLICSVKGQPTPSIFWKHNGKTLNCEENTNDYCKLSLNYVTTKDFGDYKCIAENLLGKEEWTYTLVSKGKPEPPYDIQIDKITHSSFKIRFKPGFDGGDYQSFILQINNSLSDIPNNTFEYTVDDLTDSTTYIFRIKSQNSYGVSEWSPEIIIKTSELLILPDDLPTLRSLSYDSSRKFLHFDYYPGYKISEKQLCLRINQSTDGKTFDTGNLHSSCLDIVHNRVNYIMNKDYSHLKLAVCLREKSMICGNGIEMKHDERDRTSAPMIIGIVVIAIFLVLIILILMGILRYRRQKSPKYSNETRKSAKPIVSEPLQNPYLLYSNNVPYQLNDYQCNKIMNIERTENYCCDIEREKMKDESIKHDTFDSYGATKLRTNLSGTNHSSPHWLANTAESKNSGTNSRSGSNPSSEFSCLTQNTMILPIFSDSEIVCQTDITHYGFPSQSSRTLTNTKLNNINNDQNSRSILNNFPSSSIVMIDNNGIRPMDSASSTPNRIKKLFYEVVV